MQLYMYINDHLIRYLTLNKRHVDRRLPACEERERERNEDLQIQGRYMYMCCLREALSVALQQHAFTALYASRLVS